MSHIVVDGEFDGPIPGDYSMISFGAIIVDEKLNRTFYGKMKPISDIWVPKALAISGHSREETLEFDDPKEVIEKFDKWVRENSNKKPIFWSDNNGKDFMFMDWYMHHFIGKNPFGWSSRRIGDLFCGFKNDLYYRWRKHRITKHSHMPVDDAKANAEAMLALQKMGMKIKFD